MNLIGLLGRSRSGKDTVAGILCSLLKPMPYQRVHIAGGLKKALRELYGLNDDQLFGHLKDITDDRYNKSPRDLCRFWSQNMRTMHGEDVFTRRVFEEYDTYRAKNGVLPFWIITDVRYKHDCDAIRKRGGMIWKITRTPLPIDVPGECHIEQLPHDAHIHNNADLVALREAVKQQLSLTRLTHPHLKTCLDPGYQR